VKKAALALFLLIWLSATARAQRTPPSLLTRAAHCLAIKNFLPSTPNGSRTFGYFLDEKSYLHEKVIYVVNYAGHDKSNGSVFTVFLTEHDGWQHFNIQNNATFVLSKRDVDGVLFVGHGQPLGGTWTQQHIAMAIRRIETQPRFTLNDKDLSAAMPPVTCESYTEDLRSH
jgi:hypothetical protein